MESVEELGIIVVFLQVFAVVFKLVVGIVEDLRMFCLDRGRGRLRFLAEEQETRLILLGFGWLVITCFHFYVF